MKMTRHQSIRSFLILLMLPCCIALQAQSGQTAMLKAMEQRLSQEEKEMLQRIYEPTVVGIPPSDARNSLCVMPDGEIRAYGVRYRTEAHPEGVPVYLSSSDCGLTWKQHFAQGVMGAAAFFPATGRWIRCGETAGSGTWVWISDIGPDDANPQKTKVSDSLYSDPFLPQQSMDGRYIFFTAQQRDAAQKNPGGFFRSDDGGATFRCIPLPLPPQQQVAYPHKDVRWSISNGTEPNVCETAPGKLLLLLRNSTDCFYQTSSTDNGETWSAPEPSPFQGCNTTPFLLRLSDGRIVNFWNNTRPLAEVEHRLQRNAKPSVLRGSCEDHFTNRDASHVAISEDGGKTWIGARELHLNGIRNNADFRYVGTPLSSNDKSVHQFQAIELPFHKILVAVGQNEISRKLIIFDVDWLYETGRYEDFYQGLANVSTQMYLQSVVGHTDRNGHCAYNRTHGAIKAIDPEGSSWEVVQLCRIEDPRLVSPIQGLVWNFPASLQGEVETEIYLAEDAFYLSLHDCWSNPCDEHAPESALFSFRMDSGDFAPRKYHKIVITYDLHQQTAVLSVDGRPTARCPMRHPFHIGLSYLQLQCDAPKASEGLYIRYLKQHDSGSPKPRRQTPAGLPPASAR